MYILSYLRGSHKTAPPEQDVPIQLDEAPPVDKTTAVAASALTGLGTAAVGTAALPTLLKAKVTAWVGTKLGVMAYPSVVKVVSDGVAWYVMPQLLAEYGLSVFLASSGVGAATALVTVIVVHKIRHRQLPSSDVPMQRPVEMVSVAGSDWVLLSPEQA